MAYAVLAAFRTEFTRYRALAERAMAQVGDEAFFQALDSGSNSIAVLVKHLGGNLQSRFTDFLTTDGEKPWRDRDGEFETGAATRPELVDAWERGWACVETTLDALSADDNLASNVLIRGQSLSVADALARSVAHVALHVGQIILLARHAAGESWETLSIARGESRAYNQNPTREKSP